jgi:hypothetical protein
VTDPAGKWKKYTYHASGNPTSVTEPNPASGNFATTYTYELNQQKLSARHRTLRVLARGARRNDAPISKRTTYKICYRSMELVN